MNLNKLATMKTIKNDFNVYFLMFIFFLQKKK